MRWSSPSTSIRSYCFPGMATFVRAWKPCSAAASASPSSQRLRASRPVLMHLLEDQVLVATEAQETRDLIRILVDLFKTRGENSPVITAADFDISDDKGSVTS